jgi:hypothetical protein
MALLKNKAIVCMVSNALNLLSPWTRLIQEVTELRLGEKAKIAAQQQSWLE